MNYQVPADTTQLELGLRLKKEYNVAEHRAHDELLGLPPLDGLTAPEDATTMNLADIRSRLAGLEGRTYWRSLEELADTPDFREYVQREFPAQASEFTDPAGRREFLQVDGRVARAGGRQRLHAPAAKNASFRTSASRKKSFPGRPLFYATAMPQGGFGCALLAENHMGRPTKLEGNPDHPASLGATDIFSQAAVLGLYDPDRSRTILNRGEVKTWSAFYAAHAGRSRSRQRGIEGAGAPAADRADHVADARRADQDAAHGTLPEPLASVGSGLRHLSGRRAVGARASTASTRRTSSSSLDADFLGFGPGCVRYTKDFSSRRRMGTPEDELNRLYVVEPVPTVTGANADHRLPLKARDIHAFAAARGRQRSARHAAPAAGALSSEARTVGRGDRAPICRRTRASRSVVAGDRQPAAVHALARAINEALGNTGATVTYSRAARRIAGGRRGVARRRSSPT